MKYFFELWKFSTEKPVFSSPCIHSFQKFILCGSHDGNLYCINQENGKQVWIMKTNSLINSSPCTYSYINAKMISISNIFYLSSVCSSNGVLYLINCQTGIILDHYLIEGEIFSSPILCPDMSLSIGCRDNFLYFFIIEDENI